MTATQLWLLIVLALELVTDAVEQLDVTLVGVLTQRGDKSIRHGACSLTTDTRVGTKHCVSIPPELQDDGGELTKSAYPYSHST